VKKTFLEELPRILNGGNKGKINWKETIGYEVLFEYDDIKSKCKIIKYTTKGQRLDILYNDIEFNIYTSNFINCELGNMVGKHTKKYKYHIGDVKNNLEILETIVMNYKTSNSKGYIYKCLKCGNIDKMSEGNISKTYGCNVCGSKPKKTVRGINDIATTNTKIIKYLVNKEDAYLYTKHSEKNIDVQCPECGNKSKMRIYNLTNRGFSCLRCGDHLSYPQKIILNVLEQLNIEFSMEQQFLWCKYTFGNRLVQGRYDFCFKLNKTNYIIEVDGGQHKNKESTSSKWISLADQQLIDSKKENLALENNYDLFRIDCEKSDIEFIKKSVFNSKLNLLFDLTNINWKKCDEFACKSLVKAISDLWNSGLKSIPKIIKKFKLSKPTIIKYLKQGTKLGWCDYNPKEEISKSSSKNGKKNGKRVIVVELGTIFESCSELSRQSNNLYGEKFIQSMITKACNKGFIYKGYHFRYLDLEVVI
jgi:ribosomal protein S27E